jgi:hypothetical protein
LVNYTDDGRDRISSPIGVSEDDLIFSTNNPLLTDVEDMPDLGGSMFAGNITDSRLSHYVTGKNQSNETNLIMAGFEPLVKGKVLILGSEEWVSPSYIKSSSGQIFLSNVMEWLSIDKPSVNIHYNNASHSIEVAIYPSTAQNYSLKLLLDNGTEIHDITVPYNHTLQFNYRNYTLPSEVRQEIQIEIIKDDNSTIESVHLISSVDHTVLPEVGDILIDPIDPDTQVVPEWIDSEEIVTVDGLTVSVAHTASSSLYAQLLISSHHEKTLDVLTPPLDLVKTFTSEADLQNISIYEKEITWMLPEGWTSGYYSLVVQIWWQENDTNPILLKSHRDFFFVPDSEPSLISSECEIGGLSLEKHRSFELIRDLPVWKPGKSINIILTIDDNVNQDFEVHYQLLHYYLFAADRTVLEHYVLPSVENTVHNGSYSLPTEPIPLPDADFEVKLDGELFILLFFIRDVQGNYIVEPVFFRIGESFPIDLSLLGFVSFFFIGVMGAIIFLIIRNSRKRVDPYSSAYIEERFPQTKKESVQSYMKFCVFCGAQLPSSTKFCNHCGKQLEY